MIITFKEIVEVAKNEWSIYAFIFLSPVTFLLYLSVLNIQPTLGLFGMHLFVMGLYVTFFMTSFYRLRGKFLSNESLTQGSLFKYLFLHLLKSFACIFPIQIVTLILASSFMLNAAKEYQEQVVQSYPYHWFIVIIPISIVLTVWITAGVTYVLHFGDSKHSIKNSFVVLKHKIKPILILTIIGLLFNGFALLRQLILPDHSMVWGVVDVLPMYLNQGFVIVSLLYVMISIKDIDTSVFYGIKVPIDD